MKPTASSEARVALFLRLSRMSAALVAALGLTVLAGGLLDVALLEHLHPSLTAMKPNTALLFVAFGVGLGFEHVARVRLAMGVLVIAVAALTLVQHGFGVSLGIDTLLVAGEGAMRMAPATATSFVALGAGLLLLDARPRTPPTQLLALAVGCVALLALCGHLYGVSSLRSMGPYGSIALHTVLGLLVAAQALVFARPRVGLMRLGCSDGSAGSLMRKLVPALFVGPIVIGYLGALGENRGLYDARFGIALLVLGNIGCMVGITVFIAARLQRVDRLREADLEAKLEAQRALTLALEGQRFLSELSQQVASAATNLPGLLALVARRLGEKLADLCAVRLLRPDGERFDYPRVATWHREAQVAAEYLQAIEASPLRLGEGFSGRVAETGRPARVTLADLAAVAPQTAPLLQQFVIDRGLTAFLCVPLKIGSRVIGVVSLNRDAQRPFTLEDERLAQDLADQVALVIENAALEALRRENLQLEVQNRRALEATRLKSEFLANMSHELRTPLNAVIGFAALMHQGRAGPVSAAHHEYLGDILSSSRHLLELIDDVLDLAKIESGRVELNLEAVDLATLSNEVVDGLRAVAAERGIELRVELDGQLGGVTVDSRMIKQVLYNYLSNALKFTAATGSVSLRVAPAPDDCFRIEVEDTGIGIAPADLGRLFVEFQQLDQGTAKRYPGTGLGLALTRRIVEAHGGHVGAVSTLGKGSTFSAVLPRRFGYVAGHDD